MRVLPVLRNGTEAMVLLRRAKFDFCVPSTTPTELNPTSHAPLHSNGAATPFEFEYDFSWAEEQVVIF